KHTKLPKPTHSKIGRLDSREARPLLCLMLLLEKYRHNLHLEIHFEYCSYHPSKVYIFYTAAGHSISGEAEPKVFLPTCQFLMARTGVIFSFQEVLEIVKNDIQEMEVDTIEVLQSSLLDPPNVDSTNFEKIASAKELWDILNKSYGGVDKIKKVKLQSLCKQYELLSMNDQELVGYYFTRIQMLVNSMKACGEKVSNQQMVDKILRTLNSPPPLPPSRYMNVTAIKEDEAQMAQGDSDDLYSDHALLMVTTSDYAKSDFWYFDTGCSNHTTGNKGWFVNLDENVKRMVKFANNSIVTAKGMGKVLIERRYGQQSLIKDILYVPQMKTNLLSICQLFEKGYEMNMEHNMMKVYDSKRKLILKAPLSKNRTFKIGIQSDGSHCFAIVIWASKFKRLSLLKQKGMVHGLPSIESPKELCEGCLISKQPRSSFKALLEVVYSDVCESVELVSLGGNHYFISFVDKVIAPYTLNIMERLKGGIEP
ncbi:hypothetical protein CR513_51677, partial [Mucuna pruriens]